MNDEIKLEMYKAGLKQWELAELLKMHEGTLCRKLRHELPDDERQKILKAISLHKELKETVK